MVHVKIVAKRKRSEIAIMISIGEGTEPKDPMCHQTTQIKEPPHGLKFQHSKTPLN